MHLVLVEIFVGEVRSLMGGLVAVHVDHEQAGGPSYGEQEYGYDRSSHAVSVVSCADCSFCVVECFVVGHAKAFYRREKECGDLI